jgi:tetratricopeptide (TPR) repeat protein
MVWLLTKSFMKRLIIITIILVLLGGCTSKWHKDIGNMPEELLTQNEQLLSQSLDKIKADPTDIEALFEVGYRYEQLGNLKKAVKYYKQVIEIDAVHYPALNNLANIYEEVGDYDKAAEYIKVLYQNNTGAEEVIKDTVRILLKAGDPENANLALENYAKVLRDNGQANVEIISDLKSQIVSYQEQYE